MKKIIDIYGHFARFNEMYDIDDSWFGRILVDKNNLFEGIVIDYNGDNKYFVYGYMFDNSLRVYLCPEDSNMLQKEYDLLKEDEKYEGLCSVVNSTTSIPLGESRISLLPADKTREESKEEEQSLKYAIRNVRKNISREAKDMYKKHKLENKQKIMVKR